MNDEASRRPAKARGRKRDAEKTATILQTAVHLLLEVGYDHFRVQDVAERAGAGTGAIYRRWPTKQALVAEAIRTMTFDGLPPTGDPIRDLRSLVSREVRRHEKSPDRVPGLISAMRTHEGIRDAVRDGYTLDALRTAIARVVGEDHPHLTLLSELTPAVCLLRASFAPESLHTEDITEQIMSLILDAKSER